MTLQDLMRDKYGNYVIQRIVDIASEAQRRQLIDRILKAAATMKKHKSHARHVFTFLEKNYGIAVVFNDDDLSSSSSKNRKSTNTVTGSKLSTISKNSEVEKARGTNSCIVEKSTQPRKSQVSKNKKSNVDDNQDQASTATRTSN